MFNVSLRDLAAKYILGLSATPNRSDGLTRLLYYSMGDVAFKVDRGVERTDVACILYEDGPREEITYRDGRVSLPLMINAMVCDSVRNGLIASQIARCLAAGRCVIVLSDRVVHLKTLMRLLVVGQGVDSERVAIYAGHTPAAERKLASEKQCILSTYCMAKEVPFHTRRPLPSVPSHTGRVSAMHVPAPHCTGNYRVHAYCTPDSPWQGLDIPRLDTLVMATPKGDVVQAIGRIQRQHPEKQVPLVIDVVDTYSIFNLLRWKRWKSYKTGQFQTRVSCVGEGAL
tara:strand:- start:411 stop:1265 length:855 start_codon:yes stop_codon:yes gene_type:complete